MLIRIFLNIVLTKHCEYFIVRIVEKSGKMYLLVKMPSLDVLSLWKRVLSQIRCKNVGLSVGLNVALNKTEKK